MTLAYIPPGEYAPTEPAEPVVLTHCIACGSEIYPETEILSTRHGAVCAPTIEWDRNGRPKIQDECLEDYLLRHCDVGFSTGLEEYMETR